MISNPLYRAHYFRSVVTPSFAYLRRATKEKLLPAFETVADEANEVAEAEFQRLGQWPVYPDSIEGADIAEQAHQQGLAYYEAMTAVRQTVLNVIAVALYHLFEQHLIEFYRREILGHSWAEDVDPNLLKTRVALDRLSENGIDCRSFHIWPVVDELRLVANTVKHGYGDSSKELQDRRPEMFQNPLVRGHGRFEPIQASVYTPMAGEDFWVTPEDMEAYFDAVIQFWHLLADALEEYAAA